MTFPCLTGFSADHCGNTGESQKWQMVLLVNISWMLVTVSGPAPCGHISSMVKCNCDHVGLAWPGWRRRKKWPEATLLLGREEVLRYLFFYLQCPGQQPQPSLELHECHSQSLTWSFDLLSEILTWVTMSRKSRTPLFFFLIYLAFEFYFQFTNLFIKYKVMLS
jgi:hypothetical protein